MLHLFPKLMHALVLLILTSLSMVCIYAQSNMMGVQNEIRYDEKTNLPSAIYNINSRQYSGTPEEIAREYLLENKSLFRLKENLEDLTVKEVNQSPAGNHVGLIQSYNGIPVFRSETVVSINHQNRVSMVANGYKPGISVNTSPSIDQGQALLLAKQAINVTTSKERRPTKSELVIYQDSVAQFHLAWKMIIYPAEPEEGYMVLTDAHSGRVLEILPTAIGYVTGNGWVFDPDPVTALRNPSLTDGSTYQQLEGAYCLVTLPRLDGPDPDGWYWVSGQYARSVSTTAYPHPLFYTGDLEEGFIQNRAMDGFLEVNVYYFLDKEQEYVKNRGFSPTWKYLHSNTIAFDAKGTPERNNYYERVQEYVYYGIPAGNVDGGEDQSVILHEYGHALHDALISGGTDAASDLSDTRGISEGIGDYFGISYRRSVQVNPFQPNRRFNWWYPDLGESIRSPSNAKYPNHWTPDPYAKMNVWASTLMDIEYNTATDPSGGVRLGRDITTTLVLTSLRYVTSSSSVLDNVNAILQADRDTYGGAHLQTLETAFYNRGFFYNNLVSGTISSDTTWSGQKYVTGTVTVNPGVTLTIAPNTFVFFGPGTALWVYGVLNAVGIENDTIKPIIFTSGVSQTPGSWNYVHVRNGNSVFKYCTFQYGVYGLYLNNAYSGNRIIIENCTFRNNSSYGLRIYHSIANVKSCQISNNTRGVYCYINPDVRFIGTTISQNSIGGVSSSTSNFLQFYGSVIANNGGDGILTYSGDDIRIGSVYAWWGYNTIYNNSGSEVHASSGNPHVSICASSIHDSNGLEVYNEGNQIIYAQSSYWNSDRYNPSCCQYSGLVTLMSTVECRLPNDPFPPNNWEGQPRTEGSPLGKVSAPELPDSIPWIIDPRIPDEEKIIRCKDIIAKNSKTAERKEALMNLYSIIRADYVQDRLREKKGFPDYLQEIKNKSGDTETSRLALRYMIYWKMLENDNAEAVKLSNEALAVMTGEERKLVLVDLAFTYAHSGQIQEAKNTLGELQEKDSLDEELSALIKNDIADVEGQIANGQWKPNQKDEPVQSETAKPLTAGLSQNYPNPFNPTTAIHYAVPEANFVTLKLFDILGREIATLVNEEKSAGFYDVQFDASRLSSGIYFYQVKIGNFTGVKKMLLMK